jgi:hypothetical protein
LATPTKPLFADFQEVQEQVQHAILELQVWEGDQTKQKKT